jgi:hypothetical protein
MESDSRPRFEALRASKEEGVVVWYHMALKPQSIDPAGFRKECINYWKIKYPLDFHGSEERPSLEESKTVLGVAPGQTYTMATNLPLPWADPARKTGEYDVIKGQWVNFENLPPTDGERTRDFLRGKVLTVRLVKSNFVSCNVADTIVLIPTLYLVRHGVPTKGIWDFILED